MGDPPLTYEAASVWIDASDPFQTRFHKAAESARSRAAELGPESIPAFAEVLERESGNKAALAATVLSELGVRVNAAENDIDYVLTMPDKSVKTIKAPDDEVPSVANAAGPDGPTMNSAFLWRTSMKDVGLLVIGSTFALGAWFASGGLSIVLGVVAVLFLALAIWSFLGLAFAAWVNQMTERFTNR